MAVKPYTIGYTAGSFDGLHVGHLNLLERAKEQCDLLVVAVSTDELIEKHKGIKPIIPLNERIALIKALRCVDLVIVQNELLNIDQIDLYIIGHFSKSLMGKVFLGDDWTTRDDVPGIKVLKEHNKIIFLPYTNSVSSSVIKERIINNAEAILKAQRKRNGS
jgi:glycerol-3-phosphate cytidylyltransferase